ncbi:MAG: DUF11 domain-containing protein [Saprospiraceae bacterium]|nr:DUF11 domain-containing protein [Saprospiraceae bacterium]
MIITLLKKFDIQRGHFVRCISAVLFFVLSVTYSYGQCGFQATCSNTNYLNFGMGSNGDAASVEYDNFVSMFHSTVVRTAYGSYETWGQKMENDGVNHLLSPTEINSINFPNLTGVILKAHLGSDFVTVGQGIVLTTTGLFAWSDPGAVLHTTLTPTPVFQKLTIDGQTDGLPAGVDPLDVKMIFTTHATMALVTCNGDVYVITQNFNNTGNGHTAALSVADMTKWHRVKEATSGNPFLTNVVAVRGNRHTLFALKSDGTLWTWGAETYLGNNTAHASSNYATSMQLPSGNPIKMIGVTRDNGNSRPSYYVLNANGNLYSLGHNNRKQLGDWTTNERLQWVQPRYNSASGQVMNNIHWLSPNEHDPRYAAVNILTIDSTNYNWGDANGQLLGRGGTGTFDPGIPNGINTSDKVLAVETGGHTSMLVKKCEDYFGYVGHRISGSMGDGTSNTTNESTYTFATAVVYICGATTAEISLSGSPTFGNNGLYCNGTTAELIVFPPGGTLSVLSGPGTLNGVNLTFNGIGNTAVTVRYIVTVPGCPVPDTAEVVLNTEDCFFPSWTLTKTALQTNYSAAGQVVNFSLALENTGNTGISSIIVSDILATSGPVYSSGDNNSNSILDEDEIWIYNASRSMSQADMDNGSLLNTANVTGTPLGGTLTDTFDTALVTAIQNPSVIIEKAAFPQTYSSAGDEVEYTFTVTNSGNVTLTNVEVEDPLFGLNFGPVTLAPNGQETFTYTYIVTQAAVDTGNVVNIASVNGLDPNGNPVSDDDGETITAIQNPSLGLHKSANVMLYNTVGQQIEYTIVVTNTGNVSLSDIIIEDPLYPGILGPIQLIPGASHTFIYTYEVQQIDLDLGSIFNEAMARTVFDGIEYTAMDDETIDADQNPGITLEKSVTPLQYSTLGENVTYRFIITNVGNVTLENIITSDPLFGQTWNTLLLLPGQKDTMYYDYQVTQSALDTGSVFNVAYTIVDFDAKDYEDSDNALITAIQTPSISLDKSAFPTTYTTAGQAVDYTFVVTNTGNVTLTNVEVSDPLFGLNFGPITLAPNGQETFTYTYTVTQAAIDSGSVVNLATTTALDSNGDPVSDNDGETITAIQTPSISLNKSAFPTTYTTAGQTVDYTFVVTNTGNVTLNNVEVSDPLFGLNFGPITLSPNGQETFTYTYTVTQAAIDSGSVVNLATTTALDTNGDPVSDDDGETITAIQTPSISLNKSAFPTTYNTAGESVDYTFVVTNTGNVTLNNVEVSDPLFGLNFGPVTLAPNGQETFTYTYTVTQAAIDSGSVVNLATTTALDTNGDPVSDDDGETITAIQTPSISLDKSAFPTTYTTGGESVDYTFVVTNTGNVTLNNVEVTDPLFGLNFGPITLSPNDQETFTYTYTVTQAAIDSGNVVNLATTTALDTNGDPVSDNDGETITAIQTPSISLDKSAFPTTYTTAGESVDYTFVLTNTGNVTLNNVEVRDPLFGLNFGPVTLAPNGQETFTYTYTVTQAAIDSGGVVNLATTTALDTNGDPVSDDDGETITAIQTPSISLDKSAFPTTYTTAGESVDYTFIVTNTGNVTLNNVEVSDPLFGLNFGPVTLAPNDQETFTYTYTVTQAAIDSGSVVNLATTTALDTNGDPVSDDDGETITSIQTPSLSLNKSAFPTTYTTAGESVDYTFVVTNTGNVTLNNVEVTDPLFGLNFGPITLSPNDQETFTYTYTVTQAAIDSGSVVNLATTTALDTNGDPVSDDDAETITAIQTPSISLNKSAFPTTYTTAGESVDYTFVVTNTGNVTLNNVEVSDPLFGLNFGPVTLAPNDQETFTYTYTVTQAAIDSGSLVNLATTTALDTNGDPVSDDDGEMITAIQTPSISLDKSAFPTTYTTAGEFVDYTFVVTNTGNVTLNNVEVSDPLFGLNFGPITLAPNSSELFTYQYQVIQDDLDNGSIYNLATANALDTNGDPVSDDDDETIFAIQTPSISLDKSAFPTTYNTAGESVDYTFVVTNTGNVTLNNVEVSDPLFGLNFGPVTLAPNGQETFTYTYTVTQAAIDSGSVVNLAITTALDTNGDPVSDDDGETITAIQTPSISLNKSAFPTTYTTAGQDVDYTFVVTNTGNVTLSNVEVTDPLFGLNFGPVTLAPNGQETFTFTYTVTQAAIDSGSVVNLATTTALDTNGDPVSDDDGETITAIQSPSISLNKSAFPTTYTTAGQAVDYTFVVTNTGNVTLNNVEVTDPLFGLNFGPVTLPPNGQETFTFTYTVTQAAIDSGNVVNLATTTALDTNGDPVSDDDGETITAIQTPSISLNKSAFPTTYTTAGQAVDYTFVVTNTGNVTLNNVAVSDPLFGLNFGPVTLAPNGQETFTYTYTVTQAAIDSGSVINLATTTALDTNGDPVSDDDGETITAIQTPSISLNKSAFPTTYTTAGESVDYTFVVTNTGNVTLNNVEVSDPLFGLNFGPVTLAPNGQETFTYTYTVTQAAIDSGNVVNLATTTALDTNGDPVSDDDDETITAIQTPSISLDKSAFPTTYTTAGESVDYTFVVTNTGNVTLNNVEVSDPLFGLNFGPITLAPNGQETFTYTYTVTQAAIDSGSVVNLATTTALDTNGDPVSDNDVETITAIQTPSISLNKSAFPTTYTTAGQAVDYTFVVTNTGNVTLNNVEVSDPLFGLNFGPITLAPNDQETFTYTYTVTQAAIDSGSVVNLATTTALDTNGDPVSDNDGETITAIQTPSMTLDKSAFPTTYTTAGQAVDYTFVVTNTGNVTLSNMEVSDPLFGLNFGPVTLAPNGQETFTYTYTVTQAAIDSGSVVNLATTTALDTNGDPVSDDDGETITAIQTPSISLDKSAFPTTYTTAGESVDYTFVVTNTGNVTLNNVEVSDPLFGLNFGPTTLAPNGQETFTYTYTVTQAAIDSGSVVNLATTTALDTNGGLVNDNDGVTITAIQTPSISLDKSAFPTTYTTAGQTVDYTFVVTNTGNVTLNSVEVSDPLFGLNFGPITLAPNGQETFTYTYTVTQAAIDSGSVVNLATTTALDTNGDPVSDDDGETITAIQTPSISLDKSAFPTTYTTAGESVDYTFVVTNTGNVTLNNVEVSDPLFGLNFGPITLSPNDQETFTYTYTVTQAAIDSGSVVNLATTTALDTNGDPVSDDDDETITAIQTPSISLNKSAFPTTYNTAGQTVDYTFVVTNTGNVTLSNVEVSDPLFGLNFGPVTLAPNGQETFTYTYTVTQAAIDSGSVVNLATTTALDTNGDPVSDDDGETITAIQTPSISLNKSAFPTTYTTAGESVDYTFVLTNTGNVTLSNVEVSDPLFGLNFGPVTLAPNGQETFTYTYTVTQAAIDSGSVVNLATTTALDTNGDPVSDDDGETITAIQTPSISLNKSAFPTTYTTAGQDVDYTFVVTNTGNVTLNNVEVSDPLFGLNFGPITLSPNGQETFTYTYTVTQAAIDSGSVVNLATTTALDTNGDPVNDDDGETITAIQTPSISLNKSAFPTTYTTAGQAVDYTFVVTNTGNVTLNNVEVSDPLFGLNFGPVTLAPNGQETFTYTYTVTQAAIDSGSVVNLATTTSLDTNGDPVSDDDGETITAIQTPSISLIKSAFPTTYTTAGESVDYTFVVTNTGNVTLSNVEVSDPLFGLNFGPITLAPNHSEVFTHQYQVTQDDLDNGSIYNLASANALDTNVGPVTDDDDETITAIQTPSISLDKSAFPTTYTTAGESVDYTFVVTNTGNVTLNNVEVIDPLFGLNFGPVTLAPNGQETFTYTYTVTQAAIDSGSVVNLATTTALDTNGGPVTDDDGETITAIQTPSISLNKSAFPTTYNTAGQAVDYTFVVTNTGNVTLSNVEVSDPLFGLNFGPVTLAPNGQETFTYSYTVTQAAIDSGSVVNLATTTALDTNGDPVSDDDGETITAIQTPSISLNKSAFPTTYTTAGESVDYTFVVTNTGNVTLNNVEVSDPLFGLNFGPITLAPNGQETFTYTYTVTQAAIDSGSVVNLATTTALDTNGGPVSDDDGETITAIQTPSISLNKSAFPTTYTTAGQVVDYTFVVTNTGNVTLNNVEVSDPLFGLNFGPITLAPNGQETFTYTYSVTQAAIDSGSVVNLATTTALDTNGDPVSDDDGETITAIQTPSISLNKSAFPTTYTTAGQAVDYTFVVTNTGNVTLSNVEVSDPLFGLNFGPVTLAPNSQETFTYKYTVTQAAIDSGSVVNVATTTALDTNGDLVSDNDGETITAIQTPSISLDKSAFPTTYNTAGQAVDYTFVVTNTGNVTLNNVEVTDPLFGLNFGPITLAPNGQETYTYTYTVTQAAIDSGSVVNLATTTALDTNGDPVSDDDGETITAIQTPSISLNKSAFPTTYTTAGQAVDYTFVVTNTGNVTLNNVEVSDPLFGLNFGSVTLAPNGQETFTYTYTVTQAAIDSGSVVNLATTTALDTNGDPVSDNDGETITAIQTPSISLNKSAFPTTYNTAGQTVDYTFVVTNTGNVTLNNVEVSDPLFELNFGPITLAPNGQETFTYTYTVTQAAIDSGSVVNLATTTAFDTNGDPVDDNDSETITAIQTPSMSFSKTADVMFYDRAGDRIIFNFTVTNTGNVTLSDVIVSDPLFGLQFGPASLVPDQQVIFQYQHIVTQEEVDNGSIFNSATATSKDPDNSILQVSDEITVPAIQSPSVTLTKSANPSAIRFAGDQIMYFLTARNTGNVTLTNVIISDPLLSVTFGPVSLLPDQQQTFTATYIASQFQIDFGSIQNIASVSAQGPGGVSLTQTAMAMVTASPDPSLTIEKEGRFNDENGNGFAEPGETITFDFEVTNTGNVTLSNVRIQDATVGVSNLPVQPSQLAPGQTGQASIQYTITSLDIDSGGRQNVATVSASTPGGLTVSDVSRDPTPLNPNDPNYDNTCPECTFVSLVRPSRIGNFVWHDINGNGIQDTGEPGIPNVTVNLYTSSGDYISSVSTNQTGNYLFPFVVPGDYQLRFDIPTGFTPTFSNMGNAANDSDIDQQGLVSVFNVGFEEYLLSKDAGFYRCVPIGELVWYDSNKNDIADQVENGINGLVIQLWRFQSGNWMLYSQTTTGHKPGTPSDDGYWHFCAPPGQYYVKIIMPPLGLVRSKPNVGNNPLKDSDLTNVNGILTTATFQITSGGSKLDIGAGFYPMATAGNLVWIDENGNGLQESNEPLVRNVQVSAHDVATGELIYTATTDESGVYELEYIEQKEVYLKFLLPAEFNQYQPTIAQSGSDDIDSDVDGSFGNMTTRSFLMLSGSYNPNIDLGIIVGVLPVTWGNVYAVKTDEGHEVKWFTQKEINTSHFIVERRYADQQDFIPVSDKISAAGFSNAEVGYSFTDKDVSLPGLYIYRVKQIDFDGKYLFSKEVSLKSEQDLYCELYPNPAIHATRVDMYLPDNFVINMDIYDNKGKLVQKVVESKQIEKGWFVQNINLDSMSGGVYNLVVKVGDRTIEKRIIKVSK